MKKNNTYKTLRGLLLFSSLSLGNIHSVFATSHDDAQAAVHEAELNAEKAKASCTDCDTAQAAAQKALEASHSGAFDIYGKENAQDAQNLKEKATQAAQEAQKAADEKCCQPSAVAWGWGLGLGLSAVAVTGGIWLISKDDSSNDNKDTPKDNHTHPQLSSTLYVFHTATTTEVLDLGSGDHISEYKDVIHAADNHAHLDKYTHESHRISDKKGLERIPDTTTTNAVFLDAWGSATQTTRTYLDQKLKLAALDLKKANLIVRSEGALSTLALRLESNSTDSGILNIEEGGSVNTHTLYVAPGARLTGGERLTYNSEATDQYGISINDLKAQRHVRFPWVAGGRFIIAGSVDHLNLTSGMTLTSEGEAAHISTLKHNKGTLELKTSAPFKVDTYTAGSESPIHVIWDQSTATPLLNAGNIILTDTLNVTVSSLADSIAEGSSITLIRATNGTISGDGVAKSAATFAATFKIEKNSVARSVTLTLSSRSNTTPMSAISHLTPAAHELSDHLLKSSSSKVGSRLVVMDMDTAVTALNAATAESYLSVSTPLPMDFAGMYTNTAAVDTGVWSIAHDSVNQHLTGVNMSLSQGWHAGISMAMPKHLIHHPPEAYTYGFHLHNTKLTMDAFTNMRGSSYGTRLGWKASAWNMGITYMSDQRSGNILTALGKIHTPNALQHRVMCNIGAETTINQMGNLPIHLGINTFVDVYKALGNRTVSINDETYALSLSHLNKGYGVQLQATLPVSCGFFSASWILYGHSQAFTPELALSFNLDW
ncbi:MAG: hypothetical protein H6492_02060 [Candidatus Paracaedibacteraceae bacterium]|nr:hypothetical protein [Candidatus Paracaedibacteraceae bacterium]